jgi:hypothetical protein
METGTRVMRNDGQYDTVATVISSTETSATVELKEAKRSASVTLNENGVWQEPWTA